MAGVTKLRIKLGPDGSVKTFKKYPDIRNCSSIARRTEQSVGEDANQSKKRGPQELEDVQANKKLKQLDRDLSSQCCTLLRLLMEHRNGWLFNKPVDPVKLKIPDYFSVITKPMDLGTIKSKLLRSVYSNAEEFAADVRLTFANAMTYNPPENLVHKVAKELKEIFEVRWESLKKKKIEIKQDSKRQPELPKPTKESSEKVSLLSKPVKAQSKNDTPTVAPKALITKLRIKQPDLGIGISSTVKIPSKAPATARKCGSCGMITCICLKSCNSSGSEISSLTDCQLMNTPGSQGSDSDPHYNGSVSSRNEKNGRVSSQLDNSALFGNEMKMPFPDMPPLPPEKALRAAKLKAQFAETILKAKHRKVLDQSNKVDLIRIQIEKEQMERSQREEKARIEAEMKAAKIASRIREETERKLLRERERLKVAKMEQTIYFNDNYSLILDYELVKLCGSSKLTRNRLFELGLFLRNDDCLEEVEVSDSHMRVDDLEEGEIF